MVRRGEYAFLIASALLLVPLFVAAEGSSGQCDSQYNSCLQAKRSGCEQQWQACMSKCNVGGGAVGSCNKDPECQLHCTESATSQGGRLSCCDGGPKHQNACPNKVDGNCEPKKTEGGEGGKPPELPKPPQGGGGGGGGAPQATSTEACGKDATTTPGGQPCPSQTGGIGGYLSGIFSTESGSVAGNVQSTLSSAADKLSSLFGFGSDTSEETAAQETGAASTVTVPTGGTQLVPQVVQATPIGTNQNTGAPSAAVTGFGGSNATPSGQSGIITAIGETLTGIGVTLRNLLSSFAL